MTALAARIALGALGACLILLIAALPGTAHAATRKPPPGYTIVRSPTNPLAAHSRAQGVVNCPSGTVPWGGGVLTESPDPAVTVADSFPDTMAWISDVNNASGGDTAFQVVAVCAKRPAGYSIVQGAAVVLEHMLEGAGTATCPAGTHPLSGGGFVNSGGIVTVNSSGPDQQRWVFEENNPTTAMPVLFAYAICGHPHAYRVVQGAQFTTGAGSRLGSQATCPAPYVVSGGGIFTASSDLGANVAGTEPLGRASWASFIANSTAGPVLATPEVVCVHA
jgi:hypothetical protein